MRPRRGRTQEINMHAKQTHISSFLILLLHNLGLIICFLAKPSICGSDSLIYCGCTPEKFNPGSSYESNVESIVSSLVDSAASTNYNNLKKGSQSGSKEKDIVYGFFQCRGDLSKTDCRNCVATGVSELRNTCGVASGGVASGGVIQLDGCLMRYDNISFVGVEEKKVVVDNCGASIGYDSGRLSQREKVLSYLLTNEEGKYYRVGGSGNVQGVAQCTQDLSLTQCQDCLLTAIGQLRAHCGSSTGGDVFLSKCYARFSDSETGPGFNTQTGWNDNPDMHHDDNDDDDDVQRTLAIAIAAIVGVALLVLLISVWSRHIDKKYGK